jgi:hypothetical protein
MELPATCGGLAAPASAPGNKGFDVDLLKQRQVGRGDPAGDRKLKPISESAFMRARSASPLLAAACASRPRW